ncbi:MAG: hypothetical protein ACHQ2E_10650 [Gemmatimonadales bacterium]
MKHPGITIFLLFFGISMLDAFWAGHRERALFWVAMGTAFAVMDQVRRRRHTKGDSPE